MRNEEINAKVKARNRLNAEIFNIIPDVFTALAPFVGQKIVLASGGLSQKVKHALPKLPNTVGLSAHYNAGRYSFTVYIKTCEMVNDTTCTYSDRNIYVADVNEAGELIRLHGSVLAKLHEDYPTTYSPERVAELEVEIRKAEKHLNSLRSELSQIIG